VWTWGLTVGTEGWNPQCEATRGNSNDTEPSTLLSLPRVTCSQPQDFQTVPNYLHTPAMGHVDLWLRCLQRSMMSSGLALLCHLLQRAWQDGRGYQDPRKWG
jgi:hypothetical protein